MEDADEHERGIVNHLGSRLREARIAAGLTQSQAGKLIGKFRETITEIERGRRKVQISEIALLAKAYDVPVDSLVHWEGLIT